MHLPRAMSLRIGFQLAVMGAAASALIVACAQDGVGEGGAYAENVDGCVECQRILVECTSTSKDETQFVACRDQWQTCQQGKGLTLGMCSNPKDGEACQLCRQRAQTCKQNGDESLCEQQFSVCKAFLMTRADLEASCQSSGDAVTPEVACSICQKDFAVCLSDVSASNALAVCSTKRETCLATHAVDTSVCPAPSGAEACALCSDHHADCAASAGPSCDEGFGQCRSAIAASVTCELPLGEGGAGGMGGSGGAGGGEATCAHDECAEGEALDPDCSPCAAAVCAQDSWCCDTDWDSLCIDIAASQAACSCS